MLESMHILSAGISAALMLCVGTLLKLYSRNFVISVEHWEYFSYSFILLAIGKLMEMVQSLFILSRMFLIVGAFLFMLSMKEIYKASKI